MPETYTDPTFEARLGPWITDLGETNVRPFDATTIAHAAAGAQAGRVRLGVSWGRYAADRRLLWVALVALLGALVWAMAIGIAGRPSTTPTIGRLAYTLDQQLYLADWDGSHPETVRIPGADAGTTLSGVAWAPSGQALAVTVTAPEGHSSIVILDEAGSIIGRIDPGPTDEATPLVYEWSPADDVLAVAIDSAGAVSISIYRADGSPIRTGIDLPAGLTFRPWGSLDWAPSGDRLVVTGCLGCDVKTQDDGPGLDARGGLWIVQADGSGWTAYQPETSPSRFRAPYEAVWSPTGDRIAFDGGCVRYDQDCATSGIWTMRPDGTGLMTVTSVPGLLLPAVWSPDGAHLVLLDHAGCLDFAQVLRACPSPHDSRLTIVDVSSGALTPLDEGRGQDSPVAWPGDGSLIMFDRHAADTATGDDVPEVWAVRADGTAPGQRLVRGTTDAAWQWLQPATPDPTTSPTTAPTPTQRPPSPSPGPSSATTRDGLLASLEGGALVLKNADLTDRVQIPGMTTSAGDTSLVAVAPDLRHVAARTDRGVAIVATEAGDTAPAIADAPSGQAMEFAWDPTGRTLGIFSDADPHRITLVAPDGTRNGSIELPAGFTQEQMGTFGLSWSPDSTWIALEGCDQGCTGGRWSRALLVAIDSSGSHWLIDQTASLSDPPLGGSETAISWNPDGRVAVGIYCQEFDPWCATPYESRVEVYDAGGKRLQRYVVPDGLIPDALAWSNDGSRLAIAAWRGGPGGGRQPSRLLLADDGTTTDVRTGLKLPAGIDRIRWAPGDDRLWVTGVDSKLETIDLQAGTQGEAAPSVLAFDLGVAPTAAP